MWFYQYVSCNLYQTRGRRDKTGISSCLRLCLIEIGRRKKIDSYILEERLLPRKSQTDILYHVALIAPFGSESKLARMISYSLYYTFMFLL